MCVCVCLCVRVCMCACVCVRVLRLRLSTRIHQGGRRPRSGADYRGTQRGPGTSAPAAGAAQAAPAGGGKQAWCCVPDRARHGAGEGPDTPQPHADTTPALASVRGTRHGRGPPRRTPADAEHRCPYMDGARVSADETGRSPQPEEYARRIKAPCAVPTVCHQPCARHGGGEASRHKVWQRQSSGGDGRRKRRW